MKKSKNPDESNSLRALFLEAKPAIVPGTRTSEYLLDTRPRVYIHDEMGHMKFSKEETEDLWAKIAKKKLNNGD
jgi:uroporphyrinogen-III synthase